MVKYLNLKHFFTSSLLNIYVQFLVFKKAPVYRHRGKG